ncbi:MAG: SMP-30/gluconolactonase/LRE family protein, partial [Rubricella sp.]
LGGSHGPEDIALHPDGSVWTTTVDGTLWRVEGRDALEIGRLSERPLGLEWGPDGALYIADTSLGLLRWTPDGGTEVLVDRLEGAPLLYANQLAVGSDGAVWFTVSTRRFDPRTESTLSASVEDLWEHQTTGLVARWREDEGVRVVARDLSFANGIALTAAEDALLVAETGTYAIHRYAIDGDTLGPRETIIDALPGFPDNIQPQGDGTFWIGLVSPRRAIGDILAPFPTLREVVWRLPEWVRPGPVFHGALLRIDADGRIVDQLQDPAGAYPLVTGGVISGGHLHVSSLGAEGLGVMDAP